MMPVTLGFLHLLQTVKMRRKIEKKMARAVVAQLK